MRLSELGPTATAFYRLLLALPVLWLWRVLEGKETARTQRPRNILDLALLGFAGFFFAGDLVLFHWSIHLTWETNWRRWWRGIAFLPAIRADPGAPILSAATRRNGVPSLMPGLAAV